LPATPIVRRATSGWNDMREGASYAWHHAGLRAVLLTVALLTFFGRPYAQFLPVFARDVFAVGPQGLGLMVTAPALGSIAAGAVLALWSSIPVVRTFLVGAAGLGAALVAFCVTQSFGLGLVFLFVVGMCQSGATTLANTRVQELADERLRGRVMSLFMTATWGAWRIGALPLGLAAEAWGAPLAVGVSGAILLAAVVPASRVRALWATEGQSRQMRERLEEGEGGQAEAPAVVKAT
jgi:MFS family permease